LPAFDGYFVESSTQLCSEFAINQLKVVAPTELADLSVLELQHTFSSRTGSARGRMPYGQRPHLLAGTGDVHVRRRPPAKGYQSDATMNTFRFFPATPATLAHPNQVVPPGHAQTAISPSYPHG